LGESDVIICHLVLGSKGLEKSGISTLSREV